MDKELFETIALHLLDKYKLNDWEFCWDRGKMVFGRCYYSCKLITVSIHLFDSNKDSNFIECFDTLLHEISHALAYVHNQCTDHGQDWIRWCEITGAKPNQFYSIDSVIPVKPKYKLINKQTKECIATYHRRPRWAKHHNCGLIGSQEVLLVNI